MYCKNCGKTLNQGEMFCSNCGAKVENENNMVGGNTLNQNVSNLTISNVNNLDNNVNVNQQSFNQSFVDNQAPMNNAYQQPTYTQQNVQATNQNQPIAPINVEQELRKAYIGKNAEKILKGRGGSAWLFLFGATYLLYRKLYLYGFLYLLINFLLSWFNLAGFAFIIQLVLCFFFHKIYLNYVDKKILSIKKSNPNLSFEELKNKCIKQGGISYAMIALSIGISLIIGFISYKPSSDKLVCTSNKGNITIMYNEKGITGYTATGMSYDLDAQKEVATEIGMDAYITEFNSWFKSNTSGYCTINGEKVSEENIVEEDSNNENTTVVGDNKYGYITIPKNWARFYDVDGNTSLQYSYANVYIVSLNYFEDTQYTAKEYASNYMYNKQNSSDVTGVTGATVQIGKNKEYTAYQVYMYYPSDGTYLVTYWFEAEDGKVHYIALEGPEELSGVSITDYLYIAESFSLNK